jgi:hypothetical protein
MQIAAGLVCAYTLQFVQPRCASPNRSVQREEELVFLEKHGVNVGFSIDGYRELYDLNRCGSFGRAMENVEYYKQITGHYPTFNATVGRESLENAAKVIAFFKPFGTKVTFSRMIGKYGISQQEYGDFLADAERELPVRRGSRDCTMYGGQCGAGTNNYFFANGKAYYCGNCIDLPPVRFCTGCCRFRAACPGSCPLSTGQVCRSAPDFLTGFRSARSGHHNLRLSHKA